jgi:hypothetical protein
MKAYEIIVRAGHGSNSYTSTTQDHSSRSTWQKIYLSRPHFNKITYNPSYMRRIVRWIMI